eukprot:TRINITY_DN1621_c0_g1_i2.p1 TRINITY_DN1621_c0_g1~~TRINITY_DN1621_c0_g1_i2.p1  ORF type:complete len:269 (+),score=15.71 TRINITY_DN1621_c0_g1_i2:134-940(+)
MVSHYLLMISLLLVASLTTSFVMKQDEIVVTKNINLNGNQVLNLTTPTSPGNAAVFPITSNQVATGAIGADQLDTASLFSLLHSDCADLYQSNPRLPEGYYSFNTALGPKQIWCTMGSYSSVYSIKFVELPLATFGDLNDIAPVKAAMLDLCSNEGWPQVGRGFQSEGWLAVKNTIFRTGHAMVSAVTSNPVLAMPLYKEGGFRNLFGQVHALPSNIVGDHCDRANENYCGIWFTNNWSDSVSYPDPEDWAGSNFAGRPQSYMACAFV